MSFAHFAPFAFQDPARPRIRFVLLIRALLHLHQGAEVKEMLLVDLAVPREMSTLTARLALFFVRKRKLTDFPSHCQ